MRLSASIAVGIALFGTPATAQDWPEWSNANFEVISFDEGCMMFADFDRAGRSPIKFNVVYNGEAAILWIASMDWSAVPGQEYRDLHFSFDEALFNGGTARGRTLDHIHKGFITTFDPTFLDSLASDNRLMVFRLAEGEEEPTLVADFGLAGSGAAVAALRRCTSWVLNRNAARERRERANDYIERDPFAASNRVPATPENVADMERRVAELEADASGATAPRPASPQP